MSNSGMKRRLQRRIRDFRADITPENRYRLNFLLSQTLENLHVGNMKKERAIEGGIVILCMYVQYHESCDDSSLVDIEEALVALRDFMTAIGEVLDSQMAENVADMDLEGHMMREGQGGGIIMMTGETEAIETIETGIETGIEVTIGGAVADLVGMIEIIVIEGSTEVGTTLQSAELRLHNGMLNRRKLLLLACNIISYFGGE